MGNTGMCSEGQVDIFNFSLDDQDAHGSKGSKQVCKFWQPHTGAGCRNGVNCRFAHPDAKTIRSGTEDQRRFGAQSCRGGVVPDFPRIFPSSVHAQNLFKEMLERERKLAGEWACFYHSYDSSAFVYEVQAAIAAVLFRFGARYASLPRLLKAPFRKLPDAAAVLQAFPSWPEMDHAQAFKNVGISCTTSLFAEDIEATPTKFFLNGYDGLPVKVEVLEKLLQDCGCSAELSGDMDANMLAACVMSVGVKYGLPQATGKGHTGHLLQIFVHRSQIDAVAYASLPYGVPDPSRQPLSSSLASSHQICGQARLITNPSVFMRPRKVRMYVCSAEEAFHRNRSVFQDELQKLLSPILGDPTVRKRAATGVYGGELPSWWQDVASA